MGRRRDLPKTIDLHEQVVSLHAEGKSATKISHLLDMASPSVYYHLNGRCKCLAPRYAYVPESWFVCRLCGGGWGSKIGCKHEWKLTI